MISSLPEIIPEEKAEAVIERYLSLSEAEKTYGFFDVIDRKGGEEGFTVSHHKDREGFTVSNHKSSR